MAKAKLGILLSQRKYILDLLSEAEMLECKSIDSLMDVNTKLLPHEGELHENTGRYKRFVGKLNYLTVITPNITFVMS